MLTDGTGGGIGPKQKEVTPHRGMTSCFFDGRSDWIRTSDPLLPKQVRYHAAPRSVMGCFVRKRPCFGKGGPSWSPRALPALREKPPPAGQGHGPLSLARQMTTADRAPPIDKDEREHAGRTSPFPPCRERISRRPSPANAACLFPCSQKKRDLSSQTPGPGSRHSTAEGLSDRNQAAEKEKPRSKAGGFPYGAKDGT